MAITHTPMASITPLTWCAEQLTVLSVVIKVNASTIKDALK